MRAHQIMTQHVISVGADASIVEAAQMMLRYYGQISGDSTVNNPVVFRNLVFGAILFALAWLWSLATSFSKPTGDFMVL